MENTIATFFKRTSTYSMSLIVTILSFIVLAIFAKQYNYFSFDLTITLFIQTYHQFWFDLLMKFVSSIGDGPAVAVLIFLLSVYGYVIGKRDFSLLLIISTVGGASLAQVLKVLIARPRPDPTLINQIGQFINYDSFPSGHVLTAISLYGFLFYIVHTHLRVSLLRNIIMGICASTVFLMGISRIYLGAHWFSDVLGAYLIGFVWLSVIIFIPKILKFATLK